MMQKKFIVRDLNELQAVADYLDELMPSCQVFTFTGPLGSGKTALIKKVLHICGISENVTSPTFNYINIYKNQMGQVFYHFDLYRMSNLDQFLAAGFDEYLYQPNSWVFVEWPEIIRPLLTKAVCDVALDYGTMQDERTIIVDHATID